MYAFYVGSSFNGGSSSVLGLQPLADLDYDVIVHTSDIPGSGTVRDQWEHKIDVMVTL